MQQILRPIIFSDNGMVVSGHHRASQAGAAVLRAGGNAIDAAIAASATLCVALPHMNGIGGDCFALYYDAKTRKVSAINGSGAAPATMNADFIAAKGLSSLPQRGALPVSVCGLIDAWGSAHSLFGSASFSLAQLLQEAYELAATGSEVDVYLGAYLSSQAYRERTFADADLKAIFGETGSRRLGERIPQPALAKTLKSIARDGVRSFYGGEIGKMLVQDLKSKGGLLELSDLEQHRTSVTVAPQVAFYGHQLHFAPPNSQGLALGVLAGLWEQLRKDGHDGHIVKNLTPALYLQLKEIAFQCRERYALDPQWGGVLPDDFFSCDNLTTLLSSADNAAIETRRGGGDTSTLVVVDQWGNAVSWVQSLFEDFGSGVMSPSTGIVMHNRLYLERLDDSAHRLAPGKRPFHTLCPALLTSAEGCEIAIATPGDHGQPQTLFQVLINVFEHGMNLQAAIEAPRIRHDSGSDVMYESRISRQWVEQLAHMGKHGVDVGDWSVLLGGVNAIQRAADGGWMSGADPRRSCYAVCP
ncbi:gamma-glutamyltransferase [Klebsiella sp. 2680]|uniref:gamma-glutamyltransferase family protein n=1 Tax=Klebsiella sp. 2680 TaxID=2018037 RepID=UPI001158683C|nr:gamma-glutamyltransferase [Klebsiella sp. 2680]